MNSENHQSRIDCYVDVIDDIFKDIAEAQAAKPMHVDSHDTANNQCDETDCLSIEEINALICHIADTWTPEMDEEIERMGHQEGLRKPHLDTAA